MGYMEVSYEALMGAAAARHWRAVYSFLGVPKGRPRDKLVKARYQPSQRSSGCLCADVRRCVLRRRQVHRDGCADKIENWDAVRAALNGTVTALACH